MMVELTTREIKGLQSILNIYRDTIERGNDDDLFSLASHIYARLVRTLEGLE